MPTSRLPEEASLSLACGAHGIGLFRSEFLFMGRPDLPGEEEQYEAYASGGEGDGGPAGDDPHAGHRRRQDAR